MAQQKRRKAVQPPTRTWTLPRFLLLVGYGLVFAFLGTLFLMRQELLRVGIFGNKPAASGPVPRLEPPLQATPEPQRPAVVPPPQVTSKTQRSVPALPPQGATETQPPNAARSSTAPPSARPSGEITTDEKRALDDILRSKR